MSTNFNPTRNNLTNQINGTINGDNVLSTKKQAISFSRFITKVTNILRSVNPFKSKCFTYTNPIYEIKTGSSNTEEVTKSAHLAEQIVKLKEALIQCRVNQKQMAQTPLTKDNIHSTLKSLQPFIADIMAADSSEVKKLDELKESWIKTGQSPLIDESILLQETEGLLKFHPSSLEAQPIVLQELMPILCQILEQQDAHKVTIEELACLIAPVLHNDFPSTFDKYEEQRDTDIQYLKHLITSEYSNYRKIENLTPEQRKCYQIYMENRLQINTAPTLSLKSKEILHKINSLIALLTSDPRLIMTDGILRKPSTQTQKDKVQQIISAQEIDFLAFEGEEFNAHALTGAIKQLQQDFFKANKHARDEILNESKKYKRTKQTKPLHEQNIMLRLCIPFYKTIQTHFKDNNMSTEAIILSQLGTYLPDPLPSHLPNSIEDDMLNLKRFITNHINHNESNA